MTAGRRKGCRGDARHSLPGRRPAIPGLGRCGARGCGSQPQTRATSGLRPRPLMGLCQELAHPSAQCGSGDARPDVGVRTPRWCVERRRVSGDGYVHSQDLVAPLGAPSPSLWREGNESEGDPGASNNTGGGAWPADSAVHSNAFIQRDTNDRHITRTSCSRSSSICSRTED